MCCYLQNSHYTEITRIVLSSLGGTVIQADNQQEELEQSQFVRSTHNNTKSRMWVVWGGADRHTETETDRDGHSEPDGWRRNRLKETNKQKQEVT